MSNQMVLDRLRRFLLLLAAGLFVGTVVELWFTGHTENPIQFIPFFLCASGFVAVWAVLIRPQRSTLLALRAVMALVALGSLLGIFEHVEHNVQFALEIQPNATLGDVFFEALGGANPLLAPGILALAATIAVAATYYHPALNKDRAAAPGMADGEVHA